MLGQVSTDDDAGDWGGASDGVVAGFRVKADLSAGGDVCVADDAMDLSDTVVGMFALDAAYGFGGFAGIESGFSGAGDVRPPTPTLLTAA